MGRVQWVTSRCFSWSSCNGSCAMGHGSSFQWVIVSWVVCNGRRCFSGLWVVVLKGHWVEGHPAVLCMRVIDSIIQYYNMRLRAHVDCDNVVAL